MKTPITDKASIDTDAFDSPMKARAFARRLELDRAALMEALYMCYHDKAQLAPATVQKMCAALSAARANFPNED